MWNQAASLRTHTRAMLGMIDVMEALCLQASQVAGRVPYIQAQPRTRWEQERLLEKAATAILLAPGLRYMPGAAGT